MAGISEVLTNPDSFFESRMNEPVELNKPTLIIVLYGLIAAISGYMMTSAVVESMPEVAALVSVVGIASAAGALIGTIIIWFLYTAVFYGISALLGGEGSFKRSLQFVGYGFIPLTVSSLISLAGMQSIIDKLQSVDFTQGTASTDLFANDPVMQTMTIIGVIFMLWSTNIWMFGMKHARSLTTRNAFIAVCLPLVISLLSAVTSLIGVM